MLLFHRTSIGEAGNIMKDGFHDQKWSFDLRDVHTGQPVKMSGVWLTDRPLDDEEGPRGDAVLEVNLDLPDTDIFEYELHGAFEGIRLWVIPAAVVNRRSAVRIYQVDPRTSWWYEVPEESEEREE